MSFSFAAYPASAQGARHWVVRALQRRLLAAGRAASTLAADLIAVLTRQSRLQDILNELPEGIVVLDRERRYVAWNRQYTAIYANTADHLRVGARLEDAVRVGLERGEYPEAIGREEAWLAERLQRLKSPGPRFEQTLADGRCILIEDRLTAGGGLVSLRIDITEMKRREASFRLLFDHNPVPMIVCRQSTWQITAVNDAAVRHYGHTRAKFLSMSFADVHCAVDDVTLDGFEDPQTLSQGSFKHVREDGKLIEVELRASAVDDEQGPSFLIAIIDITERRMTEHRALYLARHDSLTGLPNRFCLMERMQELLHDAPRRGSGALLFLDLDKFKIVNDTMGHAVGDALLKEVAWRLRGCVRDHDTVARLGGDEYAILLTENSTRIDAAAVCRRILSAMQNPILLANRELYVGVSIGIAMMPDDGLDPHELSRCADVAMYAAKQDGRGYFRFFDAVLDEKIQARNLLETQLQHAINSGELEVHYQPLVSLVTGQVTCMEALVRWRHSQRGLVPPCEFIPIAEETGMIADLGNFVLRRACNDAANWPDAIKVAVNVSAYELERADFLSQLRCALDHSKLPPRKLQIEVTETAVMTNVDATIQLLAEIRALGVEVAMDDFGTGYSSLGSLRNIPFDKIKIDRAFIRDASTSANGHDVLSAIVSMANALGMSTTAEGVESVEQKAIVQALNCNEMQGYLFSPAKPLSELQSLLVSRQEAA